jgi:haloalkane dehalogenase
VETYRTPDERFAGLTGLSWDTQYAEVAAAANRAAWEVLGRWDKPFLTAFSDGDPITGDMAPILRRLVPGAAGLGHPVLHDAGHFLQEDAGAELGRVVADFVHGH